LGNERRDPRRNGERDSIDTEHLAVKLRYIFENNSVTHPRTTSRARMRLFSIRCRQCKPESALLQWLQWAVTTWDDRCRRSKQPLPKARNHERQVEQESPLSAEHSGHYASHACRDENCRKDDAGGHNLHLTQDDSARPMNASSVIQMIDLRASQPLCGDWRLPMELARNNLHTRIAAGTESMSRWRAKRTAQMNFPNR